MRLKKLEVFGFKSFAEKTVVTFQPGITAIVGPNGCGKSNIVDAIVWAMGEQSAKTLRGDKMEDVLFNGSPNKKPLSLAESTLTITGLKGELPASFSGYSEVEITRRLFRSGESEYLLNRVPCRLKDVRDLLIDAGAGFKGHTIIAQGRIDQILQSSPEDRRAIIEEAAGILKYRVRKGEALRKLESTEQNLLRVRDIISEVRRQINSLERQAQKARRQGEILAEIKRIETLLFGIKYSGFKLSWEETLLLESALETEEAENLSRLGSLEADLQNLKWELTEGDRSLTALREELLQAEKELHRQEGHLALLRNQSASCLEQMERLSREIGEDQDRVDSLRIQMETDSAEQAALRNELDGMRQSLTVREAEFEVLTASFHQSRKDLENARSRVVHQVTEMTETKNREAAVGSRLEEVDRRRQKIEGERIGTEEHLVRVRVRIEEERGGMAAMDGLLTRSKEEKDLLLQQLSEEEKEIAGLQQSLGEKKEARHRKEARLHSLSELDKNLVGYQEGARAVLLSRESNPEELPGIHGVLAHQIETQPAYEKAIEAVLGERLQYLIVEDQEAATRAVSFLKGRGTGRGTFVPVQAFGISNLGETTPAGNGVIGEALALVTYPETYRGVVEHLLRNVWIVPDLETASRLRNESGYGAGNGKAAWVTLDGEVLDGHGILSGGDAQGSLPNLIPQRREIKTLEKEIRILEAELASLEAALTDAMGRRDSLRTQAEAEEGRGRELALQYAHKSKDLQVLTDEEGRLGQHLRTLNVENDEVTRSRQGLEEELGTLRQRIEGQEAAKTALEEEIVRLQEIEQESSRRWQEAHQEILTAKTGLATLTEKEQALSHRLREITGRREGFEKGIVGKNEEIARLAARKEDLTREEGELIRTLESARETGEQRRGEIARREGEQTEINHRIHEVEGRLRSLRSALDDIRSRKSASGVRKAELRLEMDHIQEYLQATYGVTAEECVAQIAAVPQTGGELVEGMEADATTDPASAPNPEELTARLTEWKEKLHRLGPVNPAAIEEFTELQTRYEFLTKQEADLTEACDTLQKTIQKINETTRDLFVEAFNAINENFQKVFRSLFREGNARLVLTDESSVLESGIEIIAQPSGKTVNHLSLLSGGEKALTAIALIFGSFLVRPTPFCVLDEIDAPLDEANTGRFLEALRALTDRSQFIVITHNKRTMEAADVLYGVTMESPGETQLISVHLTREEAAEEEETVAA